ncbi:MAG: hypothetical protein WAQ27_04770 [Candidatus Microsaccharimonas sp.]
MQRNYSPQLELAHLKNLTETDIFWADLLHDLPLGSLLKNPSGLNTKGPIDLVHATSKLDIIEATGQLLPGPGCLLSAIYTVPATKIGDDFEVHNYGKDVFNHVDASVKFERLLIELPTLNRERISGLSYLLLGDYYFEIIKNEIDGVNDVAITDFIEELHTLTDSHASFIKLVKERYIKKHTVTTIEDAAQFIDTVHTTAQSIAVFAFALFEAISQCLMLSSQDETTLSLADRKELHNNLYISLMHDIVTHDFSDRFNAGLFNPSRESLIQALERGNESGLYKVAIDDLLIAIANQLIYLLGGQVCRNEYSLTGHLAYLTILKNDPKSSVYITKRTRANTYSFWEKQGIDLVYNATTIKGEIGVNPTLNTSDYSISKLAAQQNDPELVTVTSILPIIVAPEETL